jgi:nitrobindin-like protein
VSTVPGTARLHPDVAPIAFLLGTWTGQGTGHYPPIEPFSYGEEVRLLHVGKPFLAYTQRTWALDDQRPLHSESGYWRSRPGGRVELVLAQPTGVVEVDEGVVEGTAIDVTSALVGCTASAKVVTSVSRRLEVTGDVLTYTLDMAAVGLPSQRHLVAELRRSS